MEEVLQVINISTDDGVLYGYASTWLEGTEGSGEIWMDYAPGPYSPWYTGGDEDGDGDKPPTGTPGFETITVLAALGVALIILRIKN